jgi:hypothetical protein
MISEKATEFILGKTVEYMRVIGKMESRKGEVFLLNQMGLKELDYGKMAKM